MDARGKPESGPESHAPVVLRRAADGIATLILNRPDARNALSVALMGELQRALDEISKDAAVKVVVLSANGPVFCAGHDLRELRANPGTAILRSASSRNARADAAHRPAARSR